MQALPIALLGAAVVLAAIGLWLAVTSREWLVPSVLLLLAAGLGLAGYVVDRRAPR